MAARRKALQWRDLSAAGRRVVASQMRAAGEGLPETVAAERQRHFARQDNPDVNARSQAVSQRMVSTLDNIAPHVRPLPVTLQGASRRRRDLFKRAVADTEPGQSIPAGAGWYFNHHDAIAQSATMHGFAPDTAIVASAVMSPQNAPENEHAAAHALMDTLRNRSVLVDNHVVRALGKAKIPVALEHIGKTVPFAQMHPHAAAVLADTKVRDRVQTDADLFNISRGGTRDNVRAAVDVLTGAVHPDAAIDPHRMPKVFSYAQNIRQAHPRTAVHVEYMSRMAYHGGIEKETIHRDQGTIDLYGLADSEEGLLSPHGTTAEDTWQNAVTFGQANASVGRANVLKTAGSLDPTYPAVRKVAEDPATGGRVNAHPDPSVGPAALQHAYNNEATIRAARQQSKGTHLAMPAVGMQETVWVQTRREAGKDPEYNARERREKKNEVAARRQVQGQQRLDLKRRKR